MAQACCLRQPSAASAPPLLSRTPTLVTWGGVAGTGIIWFTDWKLVLQYVPYIGGKFKTED
ncbi:PREDICTED: cytochrome b-c1 complex subunit 10 [Nipponia nippon]|uniref:cytochrome b-c1 complex subunit 10 n=1 Tax=Nipponia nippon TaxID=128390 RepID=UPI0005110242|nr:PREDICTED: cytochrome b-c1 complex subunit 10 [Nipponia nippon]